MACDQSAIGKHESDGEWRPRKENCSCKGAEAGVPLSPQLFVMVMEVIMLLVLRASEEELLSPIGNTAAAQRISIYADDVVLFVKPETQDLVAVKELLAIFGRASGLQVNYRKTSATLIRAGDRERELVARVLECPIMEFPIRYLGLQLALKPLTRNQWQPMLEAATKITPAW